MYSKYFMRAARTIYFYTSFIIDTTLIINNNFKLETCEVYFLINIVFGYYQYRVYRLMPMSEKTPVTLANILAEY